MDYPLTRDYLLSKPEALEDFPFAPDIAVFKVMGKMYATLSYWKEKADNVNQKQSVAHMNLKCDPNEALMLRDIFPSVIAGYHMNKRHWNTIILDGSIPAGEIQRMIDRSYGLVLKGMTRKQRAPLEISYSPEQLYGANSSDTL